MVIVGVAAVDLQRTSSECPPGVGALEAEGIVAEELGVGQSMVGGLRVEPGVGQSMLGGLGVQQGGGQSKVGGLGVEPGGGQSMVGGLGVPEGTTIVETLWVVRLMEGRDGQESGMWTGGMGVCEGG